MRKTVHVQRCFVIHDVRLRYMNSSKGVQSVGRNKITVSFVVGYMFRLLCQSQLPVNYKEKGIREDSLTTIHYNDTFPGKA